MNIFVVNRMLSCHGYLKLHNIRIYFFFNKITFCKTTYLRTLEGIIQLFLFQQPSLSCQDTILVLPKSGTLL